MIDVYVKHKQKPDKCRECPFLNIDDECILQSNEENFDAEDFEALHSNCPLRTAEAWLYTPSSFEKTILDNLYTKDELVRMYAIQGKYNETLEAENRELRKKLQEGEKNGE